MKNGTKTFLLIILLLLITVLAPSCSLIGENQTTILVEIMDGEVLLNVSIPVGSDIRTALDYAGVVIGPLDTISPPLNTIITHTLRIVITRITEKIELQNITIPFSRKELPNESMAAGEFRLIQAGKSGLLEQQVRHVYHNGKEVSSSIVSEAYLELAQPEIVMVGVLSPFQNFSVPGKLVYLNSGNAWLIEVSTAIRRPLVTTGDLDGRIFSISPDGKWLLFSRLSTRPHDEEINNLWIVSTTDSTPQMVDLHISNIVHFAEWQPGQEYSIAFSTVEPRSTAPGWQANNDLFFVQLDPSSGAPITSVKIVENSAGGIYGWWGTNFSWSPDGLMLAYSRPDSIGLVNIENGELINLLNIIPYRTYSDWAWIPGISWSGDSQILYYTSHETDAGFLNPEDSNIFDLRAYIFSSNTSLLLIPDIGMFAFPSASPPYFDDSKETSYISYLEAVFPSQSATSRYRIMLMDRDGSEHHLLFPEESLTGITPKSQWGSWSKIAPDPLLAILYEEDLWILNISSNIIQQITGDGLTTRLDWK